MLQYAAGSAGSDVVKSANSTENLSILKNGTDMIVSSGRKPGAADTVKLRLWNTAIKAYTLEIRGRNFAQAGMVPVLVDRYLQTETPLSLNEEATGYSFSLTSDPASRNTQRFYITFKTNTTLPLLNITLTAEERNSGSVMLQWHTSDETGRRVYQVERSGDGSNFASLTSVTPRAGTGNQSYSYLDTQAAPVNYYRIKMIGANGEAKFSETVKVQMQKSAEVFNLFPNPFRGSAFNLQFLNKQKGVYRLALYNLTGQLIMERTIHHNGGNAMETILLADTVLPGNYKLEIRNEAGKKETLHCSIVK